MSNGESLISGDLMMTRMNRQRALVCGAGGFIGSHLVKRLKAEGWWVRGVDQKLPLFSETEADEFVRGDLRRRDFCQKIVDGRFDELSTGCGHGWCGLHFHRGPRCHHNA